MEIRMANYSMDSYLTKGKSDVQDKLKKAADDVQTIGDMFQEIKTNLSDMPGGLDEDIQAMIEQAKEQGKTEADADIEGVKASAVSDAKNAADSIKTDVTQKISDNTHAKSKLSNIRSKYGKSAIERASSAIDQNSQKGKDLMQMLDVAMQDADKAIQNVKDKL